MSSDDEDDEMFDLYGGTDNGDAVDENGVDNANKIDAIVPEENVIDFHEDFEEDNVNNTSFHEDSQEKNADNSSNQMIEVINDGLNYILIESYPWWITDSDLIDVFYKFGEVEAVLLMTDTSNGKSIGSAFMKFETPCASTASKAMDGSQLNESVNGELKVTSDQDAIIRAAKNFNSNQALWMLLRSDDDLNLMIIEAEAKEKALASINNASQYAQAHTNFLPPRGFAPPNMQWHGPRGPPSYFQGPPRHAFQPRGQFNPRGAQGYVERKCFNCGQPGHMIRDCPKPKPPHPRHNKYITNVGDSYRDQDVVHQSKSRSYSPDITKKKTDKRSRSREKRRSSRSRSRSKSGKTSSSRKRSRSRSRSKHRTSTRRRGRNHRSKSKDRDDRNGEPQRSRSRDRSRDYEKKKYSRSSKEESTSAASHSSSSKKEYHKSDKHDDRYRDHKGIRISTSSSNARESSSRDEKKDSTYNNDTERRDSKRDNRSRDRDSRGDEDDRERKRSSRTKEDKEKRKRKSEDTESRSKDKDVKKARVEGSKEDSFSYNEERETEERKSKKSIIERLGQKVGTPSPARRTKKRYSKKY